MMNAPIVATMFQNPQPSRRVGVDAARHAVQPEHVHREEREVEAEQHQPEVKLADLLAQHRPDHLREPVVDAGEEAEDRAAEEHVVEVRDDEVGVVLFRSRTARARASRRSARRW